MRGLVWIVTCWGGAFFKMGSNVIIKKHSVLHAYCKWKEQSFSPEIIIGNNCFLGEFIHISCINYIEIGDNCLFGRRVTITDHSHGTTSDYETPPLKRDLYSKGPVIIGENCWIGENVCILPGVIIGKNVIIGAGSIVTHDMPDNSVVGGVPAKVIKTVK